MLKSDNHEIAVTRQPGRTNYVLVDFENVQLDSLELLDRNHFKVLVFVGANQVKLPFEVAAFLHRFGDRAEYIKISGRGRTPWTFILRITLAGLPLPIRAPTFTSFRRTPASIH